MDDPRVLWAGGIILIVVVAVLIFLSVRDQHAWEDQCRAMGGHIKEVDSTGNGVDSKGKPVVTFDTTYYCLTDDGRILDIK